MNIKLKWSHISNLLKNKVFIENKIQDIKNWLRIYSSKSLYEYSSACDKIILKFINNGKFIGYRLDYYYIKIKYNNKIYFIWNCNKPYSWLTRCSVVVTKDQDDYDYCGRELIWDDKTPSKKVKYLLYKWIKYNYDEDITMDSDVENWSNKKILKAFNKSINKN